MANQDLWRPLIDHVLERDNVTWQWVKGHSGDPMNDLVDGLAVAAVNGGPDGRGVGAAVPARVVSPAPDDGDRPDHAAAG